VREIVKILTTRRAVHSGGSRRAIVGAVSAGLLAAVGLVAPAIPAAAAPPADPVRGAGSDLLPMSQGYGATPQQRQAMQAAAVKARATGKAVAVDALTTETQLVLAQPAGGFAMTANAKPVRTQKAGAWVAVDTTLHAGTGGRIAPTATAYGTVSFSGGGTGPLVSTTSDGTGYTLSWPGALPAPTLSGSTATYADVLAGVDLQVSATETGGFREVLVVRTAAAAKNPALTRLSLPSTVTGGRGGARTADDGVVARGGRAQLSASTALMWDSNRERAGGPGPGDRSDAAHPGAAANVAVVPAAHGDAALDLSVDADFLSRATLPAYIDPTFNWHPAAAPNPAFDEVKQGSPCNGASYYNNTGSAGNYGQLGVGYNGWSTCVGAEHAMYQWQIPTVIWGSNVSSATVNATEVYSSTCNTTSTVNLHWTGTIGSGTNWNNRPGFINGFNVPVDFGPSYNGDFCPGNGSVSHGFNVLGPMAEAASGHWSSFTVALTQDSTEASKNRNAFKRFSDNPGLQIFYNLPPATPGAAQLSAVTGADNAGCATTAPYPYIGKTIASNTPVLGATVSDPDGDHLQATFKYWLDGSSSSATGLSADNLASNSTAQYSLPAAFVSGLVNGQIVDWQVQVTDGHDTSGWSPVCHFTAEPTAPSQPTIASADGHYPNTDTGGGTGSHAGTAGSFTFTNSGTAATQFAFALDIPPALSGTPASQLVTATGNTATVSVTPAAAGPHTLWVAAIDAAGDASSMAAYRFVAAGTSPTSCASLAACRNNVAISADANMSQGLADGFASYSATDLTNAGWASGGTVVVNGAPFQLPTFGAGQADNVLAANQTIAYSYSAPSSGASALVFLASSTNAGTASPGSIAGDATAPYVPAGTAVSGTYCFDSTNPAAYCPATGVITYSDGSQQSYVLTVPDWITGPATLAAVSLPHQNRPTGQGSDKHPEIFPFSVPLAAGKTVASVTLPDVSSKPYAPAQQLHVFGISARNTTTGTVQANGSTAAAAAGQSWTGAWAAPTELNANFQGPNFSNQTFRIALKPSISGSTIRVKLDNSLGTSPITIGHATVALDAGSPSAAVTGAVTNLRFAGAAGTTVPVGGMVFSDPLSFTVAANQWLLVSFTITNSVPLLVEHSWANTAHTYLSAPGSGDHTADTAGTAFAGTGTYNGTFTDLLTGLDVSTGYVPTQAVLGDGLIDAWQPNTAPLGSTALRLSDDLAATEPSTPSPFGTVAEGIESNDIMTDNPQTNPDNGRIVGGPSALSRIDRDVLDQPGISTVVLLEGLDDILNGRGADDLESNGYTQLLSYLQSNNINVIATGLTPCIGYTGDGATGMSSNDPCTTTVDDKRTTVNGWLSGGYPLGMGPWSTPALYYIDPDAALGVPDGTGRTKLNPNAAISTDHVNLTNAGYAALATAYLGPQDTWALSDGGNDPAAITAADTASSLNSPYLGTNQAVGQNPATLSATGATWATDATRGQVLTLDGATGAATTAGPVLNTAASYTVSAWVNMANTNTYNTAVSQEGVTAPCFYLQYNKGLNSWAFVAIGSDSGSATQTIVHASTAPSINTWVHLVGVYNGATHTIALYVNGTSAGSASFTTAWNATGPFDIGHAGAGNFFPGQISDVQAWNYALTAPQVTALYQQILH
jgi:hypothetical protein